MKKSISVYSFIDEFKGRDGKIDQQHGFTLEGLFALYDYLTEYENDTGEEIDLDVIALRCEFTEYKTLEEALKEHDLTSREELEANTTVIDIDGGGVIVQAY